MSENILYCNTCVLGFFFPADVSDVADFLQDMSSKLDAGEMFGVIVGALATILVVVGILIYCIRVCRRRCKSN